MQQKLVVFVWNFRHTDTRANQQKCTILWTFKIQRPKYSFNKAHCDKQL